MRIFVVFLLSTKCNLECCYCNVDAGPRGLRPVLDLDIFEKWVEAFVSLGPSEIAIQLHGGEPLIVTPPVEQFAAVASNLLARYPTTKLTDISVQSNGLMLDESRIDSLAEAGVRINISIDGPAWIHDRQRRTELDRGSHRGAIRAHHRLRARGSNTAVIAVITDPLDLIPSLQFFLKDGFREARMNPMRPQGRAGQIRNWDDRRFMGDMAVEYLRAAKIIAAHNDRHPATPFFEDNLATLTESLMDAGCRSAMADGVFLVDDRGDLWAHPGSYGIDAMRLTRSELPDEDLLRRALGLKTGASASRNSLAADLGEFRARLFTTCALCKTPDLCVPFDTPKGHAGTEDPTCLWRTELRSHLERWLREDPEAACRIVHPNRAARPPQGRESEQC